MVTTYKMDIFSTEVLPVGEQIIGLSYYFDYSVMAIVVKKFEQMPNTPRCSYSQLLLLKENTFTIEDNLIILLWI